MAGPDVVVLLGTAWSRLETHNTRWRSVLQCWSVDVRVGSLTAVDFPSLSLRNLTRPRAARIQSWHPRIEAIAGRVAVHRVPTALDPLAWRATGRALHASLPGDGSGRVLIAATPLWVPVLRHVDADRRGFDAVDDWRALPVAERVGGHIRAGYTAARDCDAVTAVSDGLAERLRADFGLRAQAVANGVDIDAFTGPRPDPPPGLPDSPFAVYLGVVQARVDLSLIAAAQSVMPVVVAGPADDEAARALVSIGATWLGPVAPAAVPALLRAAAVGLLPHRVDALTTSMSPMKVLEYLAAGLPVAATDVPLPIASDRIVLAANGVSFADAVRRARALAPRGSPDPAVRSSSWDSVADALLTTHAGL